mgnify:CR=1 FL=1
MKTQITFGKHDFIVEEMTEQEKEILKSEKPDIYKKYFKETEIKVKKNNKQTKN